MGVSFHLRNLSGGRNLVTLVQFLLQVTTCLVFNLGLSEI